MSKEVFYVRFKSHMQVAIEGTGPIEKMQWSQHPSSTCHVVDGGVVIGFRRRQVDAANHSRHRGEVDPQLGEVFVPWANIVAVKYMPAADDKAKK